MEALCVGNNIRSREIFIVNHEMGVTGEGERATFPVNELFNINLLFFTREN